MISCVCSLVSSLVGSFVHLFISIQTLAHWWVGWQAVDTLLAGGGCSLPLSFLIESPTCLSTLIFIDL